MDIKKLKDKKIGEFVSDIGKKSTELATEAGKKTGQLAGMVGKKSTELATEAGKKTGQLAGMVGKKSMEAANSAGEKAADLTVMARDGTVKAKDAITDTLDVNNDGKVDIEDIIILGLRTPGVKIDRNEFLKKELTKNFGSSGITVGKKCLNLQ